MSPPTRRRALRSLGILIASGGASVSAAGCGPLAPTGTASGGSWQRRAGLNTPRDDFGLAVAGGRLYVIGGMSGERGNDLDTVEIYDPGANTWSSGRRLPSPISSLRAAALGTSLFAVAGSLRHGEVADVWRLPISPPAAAWERAQPLPTARLGHGLAVSGQRLIAAGGLVHGEPSPNFQPCGRLIPEQGGRFGR